MATISNTGELIQPQGDASGSTPEQQAIFVNNLTQMLKDAQQSAQPSRDALLAQKSGLEVGQAGLGAVSSQNPLAFLYGMAPNSAKAGMYENTANMFNPGISSIENQIKAGDARVQNVANVLSAEKDTIDSQTALYNAQKPVWQLSNVPNQDGDFYYYNTNTPKGQTPQTYPAGKVPPGVGGSPGGSPQSANSSKTLSQSFNPYGIKMSSTNVDMFAPLGGTPGPAAVDGGNFWSFPDVTSGEKAARTLLTSKLYADDSVDQALRQWSNYTGTGKYPGYNGSILSGTGIDINSKIRDLTSAQIDVVMAAMKKAENVAGPTGSSVAPTSQPLDNSLMGKLAHQVAWRIGGMDYNSALQQLNSIPGGSTLAANFMPAILRENPNFQKGQSNTQLVNVSKAAELQPIVDAINGIIKGDSTKGVKGILSLFDAMPSAYKSGSQAAADSYDKVIGFALPKGREAKGSYESALNELRAKSMSVLNSATNLGVVTGGATANSLFPDYSTRKQLEDGIKRVQLYEQQTLDALRGKTGGTTGVTSSGLKYTVTK